MKNKGFQWNYFAWSGVIVFFGSLIRVLFPAPDAEYFLFGLPSSFLTVHVNQNLQFAVHLGIGNLAVDFLIGYLVCVLAVYLRKKLRGRKEN